MDYKDLVARLEDRYGEDIMELLEVLQIDIPDIVDAFYTRIHLYRGDLDIE